MTGSAVGQAPLMASKQRTRHRLALTARHVLSSARATSLLSENDLWAVPPRLSPPFFAPPDIDFDAPPLARVIHSQSASSAQIAQFRTDGYTLFNNFLTPAQLRRLSAAYDAAFAERDFALPIKGKLDDNQMQLNPNRQYTQRVNSHAPNAVMREIVFEMGKVCAQLACALTGHSQVFEC